MNIFRSLTLPVAMPSFLGLYCFVLFLLLFFSPEFFFSYSRIFREKKSLASRLETTRNVWAGTADDLPETTQIADLAKPILDLDTRQDRQRGRTWEGAMKEKGS